METLVRDTDRETETKRERQRDRDRETGRLGEDGEASRAQCRTVVTSLRVSVLS